MAAEGPKLSPGDSSKQEDLLLAGWAGWWVFSHPSEKYALSSNWVHHLPPVCWG